MQYTTCTILVGVMVIVSFSEEEDVQTAVDKSHGCCGASSALTSISSALTPALL